MPAEKLSERIKAELSEMHTAYMGDTLHLLELALPHVQAAEAIEWLCGPRDIKIGRNLGGGYTVHQYVDIQHSHQMYDGPTLLAALQAAEGGAKK